MSKRWGRKFKQTTTVQSENEVAEVTAIYQWLSFLLVALSIENRRVVIFVTLNNILKKQSILQTGLSLISLTVVPDKILSETSQRGIWLLPALRLFWIESFAACGDVWASFLKQGWC